MTRLASVIGNEGVPSYLVPLFWQHGEPAARIREEIEAMHANGVGGFIVESRPHPDFLGESWWENLRFILKEAGRRGMKVWVFDDGSYPSGFAGGRIRKSYPQFLKVYLREQHIDAAGPLTGASFLVKGWLGEEERLVRVVAARRTDGLDRIDAESLIDISDRVVDNVLYWDVPEGYWRVFLFVRTRNGGEEGTKDYLNPLEPGAVRAFIDVVHEAHYAHLAPEFGKTFAGFFYDEPRFGSHPTYEATLGKCPMVLPYSDSLLTELDEAWGQGFGAMLPCLWYDAGEVTGSVRFTYMDVVSRRFAANFMGQIGTWCREHGVKLIGHVVEDNGAHARLGYGAGHFFRVLRGQDVSGLDVVYQVWPRYSSGRVTTPFGYLDADFFYWGLAKMASSEGHLDPKKQGTTFCEIFGAYGWQAGLKLMKWLTDHVCVRGVNLLVPHAFSPKAFPDPDCPPHFYAGGHNPQWRYFKHWSSYANRVCHLLSGGRHVAAVGVVYHAEAEWAGEFEPFEKVVKILARRQIDCDVIPIDTLVSREETIVEDGGIRINEETYRALVVPYAQALPEAFLTRLLEMADRGVPIFMMRDYPTRCSRPGPSSRPILTAVRTNAKIRISDHDRLVEELRHLGAYDLTIDGPAPDLRYYAYSRPAETVYFFTNESLSANIDVTVRFRNGAEPVGYDAMTGRLCELVYTTDEGQTRVRLRLEPWESLFVIFPTVPIAGSEGMERRCSVDDLVPEVLIDGTWAVSKATAEEYPAFAPAAEISGPGNVSVPGCLPSFSGTLRYEVVFELPAGRSRGRTFLDLGRVFEVAEIRLNGHPVGVRICPPYRLEVTEYLLVGPNRLQIDVTNTLAKQCGANHFDRAMPQEPSGLLGPVRLLSEPVAE